MPIHRDFSEGATIVVAASDSLDKSGAKYICDGTDDQEEIQAAIDEFPLGGCKVQLLDGTYTISNTIWVSRTVIEGAGVQNTILRLANGAINDVIGFHEDVDRYFFCIRDLKILGDLGGGTAKGINTLNPDHPTKNLWDGRIENVFVSNMPGDGVLINSPWGWVCDQLISEFNGNHGLVTNVGTNLKMVNCKFMTNSGDYGVELAGDYHKIIGCEIIDNLKHGMRLSGGKNVVTGCQFKENSSGGAGFTGLRIYDSKNNISNCLFEGALVGTQEQNGIYITSSDCMILNNVFTGGWVAEAIRLYDTATNNLIKGNALPDIRDDGYNNRIYDQHTDPHRNISNEVVNYIHAAIVGTGAEQEITAAITNTDVPRNVTITTTNVGAPSGDVKIDGVDARGNTVSEYITITPGATVHGNVAFSTVTKITIPATVLGTDNVEVGIGSKLGLSNIIYATGDVFKVRKNDVDWASANWTVNATYHTVDVSTGGAIVIADDFEIYYRSNLNIIG